MNAQDILRVAAEAPCSPDTVRRYIEGRKVTDRSRERIEAAMKKLKKHRLMNENYCGQ